MKWKNKGHEYDNINQEFNKQTQIWIYGAGDNGKSLYQRLSFADCVQGFIDNDINKIGVIKGKRVVDSETFFASEKDNCIVVVAVSLENVPAVMGQMIRNGWEEGKNLFIYHIFLSSYLPIYALRSWNKIYIPSLSFIVTSLCNLDCIGCLNFNHFNRKKRHYDIEQLKNDIDSLFEKADYIGFFHISGGEPFLYPHLNELLLYIDSKYKSNIGMLGITTNGTIIPTNGLCEQIKNANVCIWLDNYQENVELSRKNLNIVKEQFERYEISFINNCVSEWLNIKNEKVENDEQKLQVRCDACNVPFISLKNQRLFGCNYTDYACEADIVKGDEHDYLDLSQIDPNERAIIIEFIMGYSIKGYYSFCKNCSGFLGINNNQLKVAEQY